MAADLQPEPSFSPRRRWLIALNVALSTLAALAVVVLANYLSRDWSYRFHCSSHGDAELSPLTLKFVRSITNTVKVTLFYNKKAPLYSMLADLLGEYQHANGRIMVQSVDYNRDPGAGLKVREAYKQLLPGQKDVVIFDCGSKQKVFPGSALTSVAFEDTPDEKDHDVRRKVTLFEGEKVFTSILNAVTSPTRPKACFLQGHGEHRLQSGDLDGYIQFLTVLRQNNIEVEPIEILGTNGIPADCDLLIVAGPQMRLADSELEKIDQFLNGGGRLFALFKSAGINRQTGTVSATGLEPILAKWGVEVGDRVIVDPEHCPGKGYDFVVLAFSGTHPVVNPLIEQGGLQMMPPRSIHRLKTRLQASDALKVEEIAFTGTNAYAWGDPADKHAFPVMAAVDATIKGVTTERGSTRLLVVGDSFLVDNQFIAGEPNRGFVTYAANWLLDRPQLLDAIGPRPVRKYRVIMTPTQLQSTQWLLMVVMPGGVVFLGGLVWFRRRR